MTSRYYLTTYYLLLIYYLLLTTYYSLLTTYYLLLTTYYCTARYLGQELNVCYLRWLHDVQGLWLLSIGARSHLKRSGGPLQVTGGTPTREEAGSWGTRRTWCCTLWCCRYHAGDVCSAHASRLSRAIRCDRPPLQAQHRHVGEILGVHDLMEHRREVTHPLHVMSQVTCHVYIFVWCHTSRVLNLKLYIAVMSRKPRVIL